MKKEVVIFVMLILGNYIFAMKGNLKGKIIDALTKQPLISANVTIVGEGFGATTDNDGYFIITNIPEKIHKVKIQYLGYQVVLKTDVRIVRGKTTDLHEIEMNEAVMIGEEIVFTAGYFNDTKEAPISRQEMSNKEIVRTPGAAGDVFRAVTNIPGVSSVGGEFSAFFVRGSSPKDNLILIDNIPFSNTSHFNGGGNEKEASQGGRFSIFTTGLIQNADLKAGGFSAKYGGKRASVLSLDLNEGNKESFKIDGTYDLFGWEVNYSGPAYFTKNSSLVFSARQQDLKAIFNMTGQLKQGHPAFSDYVGKYVFEPNGNNKLSFLGVFSEESMDRDVKHIYKTEKYEDLYDNKLIDHYENKLLLGMNWRNITKYGTLATITLYYSKLEDESHIGEAYINPIDNSFPNENEVNYDDNIFQMDKGNSQYGIKTSVLKSFNKFDITIGGGYEEKGIDLKAKLNKSDTVYTFCKNDFRPNGNDKFIIRTAEHFNSNYNGKEQFYNLFGEFNIEFITNLTISPSFRYDYNTIAEKNYLSPRISARYQLNDKTSLNFASGIFYQDPDIEEVAKSKNNHGLENEESIHYIAGITHYLRNDIKISAETYYKKLDNLVVKSDRTNNDVANSGEGYSYGFDLSLVKRLTDKLFGQVGYSYSISKKDDNNGNGEYDSDFNQPQIFNILLGYQFDKNWSVSTKWKYATGLPTNSYIIHKNVHNNANYMRYSREYTGINNERLSDYHVLNLRVDYRKQFFQNLAIIAYIDILNAYNHLNVNSYEFIKQTGEIKEKGLKIMPSFGFKFEF